LQSFGAKSKQKQALDISCIIDIGIDVAIAFSTRIASMVKGGVLSSKG